jgi:hypothetical protein
MLELTTPFSIRNLRRALFDLGRALHSPSTVWEGFLWASVSGSRSEQRSLRCCVPPSSKSRQSSLVFMNRMQIPDQRLKRDY